MEIFSKAIHIYYCKHIYTNIKKKDLGASKAYTNMEYNNHMKDIEIEYNGAYNWLKKIHGKM
jgi:hypothetical protein